jgi:hypothetical protein
MPGADTFVRELEEKNAVSFQRLMTAYEETVRKEDFSPADVLRLELRSTIEATEVAAMWLTETEALDVKMTLAGQCGDSANRFTMIGERLAALGIDLLSFDARFGGYTKLFALFRSLQTTEERTSGGALTLRAINLRRFEFLATYCQAKGDAETARLLRDTLAPAELAHVDNGRRTLLTLVTTEEAQARARRAAFRTIELLGEVYEGAVLRKFLARSMPKRPSAVAP